MSLGPIATIIDGQGTFRDKSQQGDVPGTPFVSSVQKVILVGLKPFSKYLACKASSLRTSGAQKSV